MRPHDLDNGVGVTLAFGSRIGAEEDGPYGPSLSNCLEGYGAKVTLSKL